jgi:hypothetical protein
MEENKSNQEKGRTIISEVNKKSSFPVKLSLDRVKGLIIELNNNDFNKGSAKDIADFFKNEKFPFLAEDFDAYLDSVVGPSSKESYITYYLHNIVKILNEKQNIDAKYFMLLPIIAHCGEINNIPLVVLAIEYLVKKWKEVISEETDSSKKHTYRNYGAALNQYLAFIEDYYYDTKAQQTDNAITISNSLQDNLKLQNFGPITLSKKDLYDKFKSSLKTQDRFPKEGVYYPIRLISKIFSELKNKNKENKELYNKYNKWYDDCINNIIINVRDVNLEQSYFYFKFKDLSDGDYISICKNNNVKLHKGDVEYQMINFNGEKWDSFTANVQDDISIEHDPSIATILGKPKVWKALNVITDTIKEKYNKNDKSYQISAWNDYKDQLSGINLQDILDDLYRIENQIELSLMNRALNSSLNQHN